MFSHDLKSRQHKIYRKIDCGAMYCGLITIDQWRHVLWPGKSKFNLNGSDGLTTTKIEIKP